MSIKLFWYLFWYSKKKGFYVHKDKIKYNVLDKWRLLSYVTLVFNGSKIFNNINEWKRRICLFLKFIAQINGSIEYLPLKNLYLWLPMLRKKISDISVIRWLLKISTERENIQLHLILRVKLSFLKLRFYIQSEIKVKVIIFQINKFTTHDPYLWKVIKSSQPLSLRLFPIEYTKISQIYSPN